MSAGSQSSGGPAVVVDDVRKTFQIPHEHVLTLKERVLHPFRRTSHEEFNALKGVSFTVQEGEFFGILGRNGSGKSTLLKCLAGIYGIDDGSMRVRGRMSTFIELGIGFNPDLAARDNIVMNAIMLGLTPKQARALVEPVIEFAELEDFVDLKLKNYSSGMEVRLGFSTAIQAEADILLVDEVLAVGDAAFQQKCFDVFNRMRDEGRTLLFVTHDMGMVKRFCHRAMLLEEGEVTVIGDPEEVADAYLELNFARTAEVSASAGKLADRPGDHGAQIGRSWMQDEHGETVTSAKHGSTYFFYTEVEFLELVENPVFTLAFHNEQAQQMLIVTNALEPTGSGSFPAGHVLRFCVSAGIFFAPGRYHVSAAVAHRGAGEAIIDRREKLYSFVVANPSAMGGLVDQPHALWLETVHAVTADLQESQT